MQIILQQFLIIQSSLQIFNIFSSFVHEELSKSVTTFFALNLSLYR